MHFPTVEDTEERMNEEELAKVDRLQRQKKRRKPVKKRAQHTSPNQDTSHVFDREVRPK